jgi:hypothetical protein
VSEISCYCAFCRMPRKVYRKNSLSLINFIQAVGIAASLSYVFWQELDPRALVVFVLSLMVIEIAILARRRYASECPHCGFDPLLYLRDQLKACEKVKNHLEARKEDPDVWLARKPPIRLPGRKKKSSREIIV